MLVDGDPLFLASVPVFARETTTLLTTPTVLTDPNGWFRIPEQVSGTYEVCVTAPGFSGYCSPVPFVVGNETVYLTPIALTPQAQLVTGRVRLTDFSPSSFSNTFFGVEVHTTVRLVDRDNVPFSHSVTANAAGRFAIGGAPSGSFTLRATMAGLVGITNVNTASATGVELVIPNSQPIIRTLVARSGGLGVRRVLPGATVVVTAEVTDPDAQALHFDWKTTSGVCASVDAPSVSWQLPNYNGAHRMDLLVTDGHSYVLRTLQVTTGPPEALFTGTVVSGSSPIPNARVTVNQSVTTSAANGHFQILVPETNRYVISVSKFGYGLQSVIGYEGTQNQVYDLVPASVFSGLDPAGTISVGPPGTQLTIPPHALVDDDGVPVTGLVSVAIAPIDLDDPVGRLPGDWTGKNQAGATVRLVSFGAVDIQVANASGRACNLRSGQLGTLSHVASSASEPAPSTIPVWYYDSIAGVWNEEGSASLSGNTYTATLAHFSVVNLDLEKVNAACLRCLIDEKHFGLGPHKVRISMFPTGPVFDRTMADAINVLVRLPPNIDIRLDILDGSGNPIALAAQVVNTGPATPAGTNLSLAYPYAECANFAELTGAPRPQDGQFLYRRTTPDAATANAYYAAIDPTSNRTTLVGWKAQNGFSSPASAATAIYFNAGDLAFGRLMKMAKSANGDIAYAVSNFATADAAVAYETQGTGAPGATVAMEYSAYPAGGARYTKFYVFDGAGARINSADLDGLGEKFIPGLCLNCHNGSNFVANSADPSIAVGNLYNARFLPFDLDSFEYSTTAGWTRADQEAQFKELNRGVVEDTNPSPAMTTLVEGWYGGTSLPGVFDGSFVPPGAAGWSAQPALYSTVVATSCRTCHIARDGALSWGRYSDFQGFGSSIQYDVCEARVMPHARTTYLNFWFDPARRTAMGNAGLSGWAPTDPCPSGPPFTLVAGGGSERTTDPFLRALLGHAYPNPTRLPATIPLQLAGPSKTGGTRFQVEAIVFDVRGRLVRRLFTGPLPPGQHQFVWDGKTSAGRRSPNGVFYVHVTVDGEPRGTTRVVRVD